MQRLDKTTLITIALVFIAGLIASQIVFSEGDTVSDYIAMFAACVAFLYAHIGLEHNRNMYNSSIKPVIERFVSIDESESKYNFKLCNYGTGTAVDIKYIILQDDIEIFTDNLKEVTLLLGNDIDLKIGAELGLSPNSKLDIISISTANKETFTAILNYFKHVKLKVSYASIQGQREEKTFLLSV